MTLSHSLISLFDNSQQIFSLSLDFIFSITQILCLTLGNNIFILIMRKIIDFVLILAFFMLIDFHLDSFSFSLTYNDFSEKYQVEIPLIILV